MYRFFAETSNKDGNLIYLYGNTYAHIKNSLRKKVNDEIEIIIDKKLFLCKIIDFEDSKVVAEIIEEKKTVNESNLRIHYCQSIPKKDKPESIFQRAVELGVVEIIPFISNRTIVKFDEKSKRKKQERYERIVESSSKQSKRDIIPQVSDILEFDDLVESLKGKNVMLAYEEGGLPLKEAFSNINQNEDIYILIGPEGGFEKYEVEKISQIGGQIISLGNRILRVETAGLSLISILQYELGDM